MKTIELDTEYTLEDRAEKISERSLPKKSVRAVAEAVDPNVELTGEELRWMYSVFKGDFRIIPRRVVQSVISKGLGIPNLGGAFNLTNAGRNVFRRASPAANDELHIVKSNSRHRSNWRLG